MAADGLGQGGALAADIGPRAGVEVDEMCIRDSRAKAVSRGRTRRPARAEKVEPACARR